MLRFFSEPDYTESEKRRYIDKYLMGGYNKYDICERAPMVRLYMMNTEKRTNIKGKAVMCLLLVGLVTVAALIVALRVRIAPAKIISQPSDNEIMQEEVEAAVVPEQVGPTGNTDILLT